ncbi:MAG: hypothetical protein CVT67_04500 [Actinobacteria bacterium HGW-Actinobacteria-7]|nr:MAG: hypothetical protein CVT67_04500 [Actinobacteria bacterium HGW-Actinobacteria-7]
MYVRRGGVCFVRTESVGLRGLALRRRPDVALVDAAVKGDPVAFSEVYRRFRVPVYAFCLSRLMKPGLAEDAAQEVFVRLLAAQPGSIDKPLSWLYGVARHVCIDMSRRSDHEFASDVAHLAVADPFDTEAHVTAREDGERIAIALRSLNPRYRTILMMHEMHAQSAPEIADAFGIGVGATYTLLSRARGAFELAYTKAESLSAPCKHALGLLYRREAQSISDTAELRLEQHLEACPSCAREARRVERSRQWTLVRSALTLPALQRAWGELADRFGPAITWLTPETSNSLGASVGAALTAVALGTTAVLIPIAATPRGATTTWPESATIAAQAPGAEAHALRQAHTAARSAGESDASATGGATTATRSRAAVTGASRTGGPNRTSTDSLAPTGGGGGTAASSGPKLAPTHSAANAAPAGGGELQKQTGTAEPRLQLRGGTHE